MLLSPNFHQKSVIFTASAQSVAHSVEFYEILSHGGKISVKLKMKYCPNLNYEIRFLDSKYMIFRKIVRIVDEAKTFN